MPEPPKRPDPRRDPFGGMHVGEPIYPRGKGLSRPLVGSENLGSGKRQEMAAKEQYRVLDGRVQALNREAQARRDTGFGPTDEQLSKIMRLRRQQEAARRLMR